MIFPVANSRAGELEAPPCCAYKTTRPVKQGAATTVSCQFNRLPLVTRLEYVTVGCSPA
jgi:hypothetical protein